MKSRNLLPLLMVAALVVFGAAQPSFAQGGPCGNGSFQPDSQGEECDDGNNTNGDGCSSTCTIEDGWECNTDSPTICNQIICGNGIVQAGEQCDGGGCCTESCTFVTAGTTCRASAGVCDPAETCTGASGACPGDAKSSAVCRASGGVCDIAESCDGTNNACPADTKSTAVCRASQGICDVGPETCDGTNNACPADVPQNAGTVCRASAGVCDVAETCDGVSGACPADAKQSAATVCRASGGVCDVQETCTGTTNTCPADAKQPTTTVCRPAVNPECDQAENCNGAANNCPDDILIGCADDDGIACTEATCTVEGCVIADTCQEICRGPGYWQTHSGWEKDGENVGGAVLDDVGSIEVCGQQISTTGVGSLDSLLEAVCTRVQGVKERQLYRQLATAAFNCAISEGGTCQQITERFIEVSYDECDALCAGNPVDEGPSLKDCKNQLACFNAGGRVIDGQCAKGTCPDESYCGADYGACAGEDPCTPFEDACSQQPVCSDDLDSPAQVCPQNPRASSPKACRDARKSSCSIDGCF